jgi:hypothetical protein
MLDNEHCCHIEATIPSSFIVVELHSTVSNIKVFSFAIEMLQFFPLSSLSSYKIFRTAVNQIKFLNVIVFSVTLTMK